jgi:acetyl-CoA C-acetyltransferase
VTEVVIIAAKRTPVGNFLGAYSGTPAHELGRIAIVAALAQAGVRPDEVDEVILGQVLTAAQGQNPARQASMAAGIPQEIPAWSVQQVCGSGLRSVMVAAQSILAGDAKLIVAGGQENMTLAPHAQALRAGQKMGSVELVDTMLKDGLTDVFNCYHMGITAENLAEKYSISRETQDEFATASQNKAEAARREGRFDAEIAPVTIKGRKGDTIVDKDEFIREGVQVASLAALRPAFKKDGSVTAANASGINDAAAMVVLATKKAVDAKGLKPLAKILSWGHAGVEPLYMGIGPVKAVPIALQRAGLTLDDIDVIEANEAFAAQACAVAQELGFDPEKVNPNGSGVALGHPVGATGTILTVKAIYELERIGGRYGLITMCIGGGQGIAMVVERCA